MNSIDLELKIEGLKKAIAEHKDFTGTYESQLVETELKLKDLGKIALPPVVFDDIYEAIEKGVNKFDWTDTDNFDKEFSIDYDKSYSDKWKTNKLIELRKEIRDLENKLDTIQRISKYGEAE